MTIKEFSIEYDAINNKNIFSNGDTVNGRIIVWASKDSRIRSLAFLAEGVADVGWTEHEDSYISECERYYSAMHFIIQESRGGAPTVIDKGRHIFPFSFKFPDRDVATSFTSNLGNIRHVLQAKLKPFKKRTRWIQTIITFISKTSCNIPQLMEPVHDSMMKIFRHGSGSVLMNASIERQGFKEGDALCVTLIVNNLSGRKVRPKFTLYDQQTFTAQHETLTVSNKIMRKRCEVVKPKTLETVTAKFGISKNLPPSALNCSIIKLRYWVEVSLDIPFAENLKITLPIVILPSFRAPTTESLPAAGGLETVGSSIPTQWSVQRAAALPDEPPPAYEDCVMDTH